MKKFFLTIGAVAMLAGFTGCKDAVSNSTASDSEKALGDSIAVALGQFAGAQENQQAARRAASDNKFDRNEFLRGVEDMLAADTANTSYIQGLQFGMQLIQPIIGISQQTGVPVNADIVKKAFRDIYLKDSIGDISNFYANYELVMTRLNTIMEERELAKKAESPEAKANLQAGKEYVDSLKTNDPTYAVSNSGLLYKIENPGQGEKVQAADRVEIRYVGKKIDGTVFDQTRENPYKSSASAFIPGFNEGLQMLAKGGKATIVIPADIAYGVKGAGSAIGPNETLVFDIEVVDVTPADKK